MRLLIAFAFFATLALCVNAQCTASTCSACLQNAAGGCAWNPLSGGQCFTLSSQPSLAGQAVQVAAYCQFSSCISPYVNCIMSNPSGTGACNCISNLINCVADVCTSFSDKSSCDAIRTGYCSAWPSYGCTGSCPGFSGNPTTSSSTTTKPASTLPAVCTSPTGDCSFYSTCLDARVPCSLSTNVLASGFCSANFSTAGLAYSSAVRLCIQRKVQSLLTGSVPSCDRVRESIRSAFEDCDVSPSSGVSLCQQSAEDRNTYLALARSGTATAADLDTLRRSLAECAASVYSEVVLTVADALAAVQAKEMTLAQAIATIMNININRITLFFRQSTKRADGAIVTVGISGSTDAGADVAAATLEQQAATQLNGTVTVESAQACEGTCGSTSSAVTLAVSAVVAVIFAAVLLAF